MNKENTDLLVSAFPMLYSFMSKENKDEPISFGFEIGDGWFDIIFMLSAALEKINESYDNEEKINVVQCKEKFGALRFYTTFSSPEIDNLIFLAEMLSKQICEVCGDHGCLSEKKSWLKVLCKKHADEFEYDQTSRKP